MNNLQAEVIEDSVQVDPAGFHLIPLPFADDIRQPTVEMSAHCKWLSLIQLSLFELIWNPKGSPELRKAAVNIIERLKYSAGYDPEAIPNPCKAHAGKFHWIHANAFPAALALHYGFLQAEAFGEEYNPEEDFNDRSAPRFRAIHKVGFRLL